MPRYKQLSWAKLVIKPSPVLLKQKEHTLRSPKCPDVALFFCVLAICKTTPKMCPEWYRLNPLLLMHSDGRLQYSASAKMLIYSCWERVISRSGEKSSRGTKRFEAYLCLNFRDFLCKIWQCQAYLKALLILIYIWYQCFAKERWLFQPIYHCINSKTNLPLSVNSVKIVRSM